MKTSKCYPEVLKERQKVRKYKMQTRNLFDQQNK